MPCSAIRPRFAKAVVNTASGRGEAQVAEHGQHEAEPGAGSVDRGEHRFAHRQEPGVAVAEVVAHLRVPGLHGLAAPLVRGRDPRPCWWPRAGPCRPPAEKPRPEPVSTMPTTPSSCSARAKGVCDLEQHLPRERVEAVGSMETRWWRPGRRPGREGTRTSAAGDRVSGTSTSVAPRAAAGPRDERSDRARAPGYPGAADIKRPQRCQAGNGGSTIRVLRPWCAARDYALRAFRDLRDPPREASRAGAPSCAASPRCCAPAGSGSPGGFRAGPS